MILRDPQGAAPAAAFFLRHPLLMLLQGNAAGHHMDGVADTVILQHPFHLLRRCHDGLRFPQPQLGEDPHKEGADALAGENIGDILLVKRVIGMNDGRARLLGNIARKLVAEILALAVDHIRLPADQLFDIAMAVGDGHPHIRIDHPQRNGFDVINVAIPMTAELFGDRQYPHLMPLLFQLLHQIPHRGHHTVGAGGIQVRGNQHFHGIAPFLFYSFS